jgi:protease-4
MSLDADLIVDRRRIRRKLTFWRVLAIVLIVGGIAGAAGLASSRIGLTGVRPYIARVTISGLIRGDQDRVEQLDRLAKSTMARAVIVHVDSPGGTTAGSEQLFESLSRVREKKPLVIVVDSMAASGGYITALAADHIVAQQTSLVGSIGVLFQYPNFTDLLGKIGVKVEAVKSTPLKAVDDGRVFTGHQGLDLKLIDELGDERAALAWLAKEKNVDTNLPVRDYQLQSRFGDLPFLHAAAVALLDAAGLGGLARRFDVWGGADAVQVFNLDGLLALWHPPSAN